MRGIDLSIRMTTPLDPGSGKWFKHPSLGARTAVMRACTEKRDNPGSGNLRIQDCWNCIQVWNKDAGSNSEQFDVNSRCSLNSFVFLSPLFWIDTVVPLSSVTPPLAYWNRGRLLHWTLQQGFLPGYRVLPITRSRLRFVKQDDDDLFS